MSQQTATETEAMLVEIWQAVLHVDTVDLDVDFFAAGGDSLILTTLFAELRRRRSMAVRLRDLAQATTIREAAAVIDAADMDVADVTDTITTSTEAAT